MSSAPLSSSSSPATKKYWNRETSARGAYDHDAPIIKPAKILSLSEPLQGANQALHTGPLPDGASLLAVGTKMEDFDLAALRQQEPNVIFVGHWLGREELEQLLEALPSVEWVHSRATGIDSITSPGLIHSKAVVTNARGNMSSTLAEYTMMVCLHFAKDVPRLIKQQQQKEWGRFNIVELRNATLGVIGYGDIGRACAKLAKGFGMKVAALRRNPNRTGQDDPFCDVVYGADALHTLLSESDYIVIAAPLTPETHGMIGKEQLACCKKTAVIINVGRGPIIDEEALIEALRTKQIRGAGLDVFCQEPLPTDNPLWELDNVLISPYV